MLTPRVAATSRMTSYIAVFSPSGSRPKPVKGAPGGNRAFAWLPGPGSKLQSAEKAAGPQPPGAMGASGTSWLLEGAQAPSARQIARRSLIYARFGGAAAARKATKAGNQRTPNSYPGFPPRQNPARPNSKSQEERRIARRSLIYAHFSVSLTPCRRGKQPRPETGVAGTAIPDSHRDKALRGQKPGRTPNRAQIAHLRAF